MARSYVPISREDFERKLYLSCVAAHRVADEELIDNLVPDYALMKEDFLARIQKK